MKKLLAVTLTSALVLTVGTTSAFAMGHGNGTYHNNSEYHQGINHEYNSHFVDEDGDGICDYIGTSEYYVDANGDGICDNYGTGYHNSENHNSGNHRSGGRHHS